MEEKFSICHRGVLSFVCTRRKARVVLDEPMYNMLYGTLISLQRVEHHFSSQILQMCLRSAFFFYFSEDGPSGATLLN